MESTHEQEEKQIIDILSEQVQVSSSINRSLGLFFSSFSIYILITIGATTDLMLLIPDSKVALPLLDIELPLKGFYIVTPVLMLAMHLNLLINLQAHSQKLNRWLDLRGHKLDHNDTILHPFLFNYYRTSKEVDTTGWLSGLLVALVAYYLPMGVLLSFQLRFADYQSLEISTWHMVLFMTDALLVFIYRASVRDRNNHKNSGSFINYFRNNQLSLKLFFESLWHHLTEAYHKRKPAHLFGSIKTRLLPGVNLIMFWSLFFASLVSALVLCAVCISGCFDEMAFDKDHNEQLFFLPRISVPEQTLNSASAPDAIKAQYIATARTVAQAELDHGSGINLRGRRLRYSNLYACRLYNADLREADLHGSQLFRAELQGSKANKADLSHADLGLSHLEGADLSNADLHCAYLYSASCQSAIFNQCILQGARLTQANFESASLFNVKMQGIDGQYCNFNGCNLAMANLDLTVLSFSKFESANLSFSSFRGAILLGVQLISSKLTQTSFEGAALDSSKIIGCELDLASFIGANCSGLQSRDNFVHALKDSGKVDIKALHDSIIHKLPYKECGIRTDSLWENRHGHHWGSEFIGHRPYDDSTGFVNHRTLRICSSPFNPFSALVSSPFEPKWREINQALMIHLLRKCPMRWSETEFERYQDVFFSDKEELKQLKDSIYNSPSFLNATFPQ